MAKGGILLKVQPEFRIVASTWNWLPPVTGYPRTAVEGPCRLWVTPLWALEYPRRQGPAGDEYLVPEAIAERYHVPRARLTTRREGGESWESYGVGQQLDLPGGWWELELGYHEGTEGPAVPFPDPQDYVVAPILLTAGEPPIRRGGVARQPTPALAARVLIPPGATRVVVLSGADLASTVQWYRGWVPLGAPTTVYAGIPLDLPQDATQVTLEAGDTIQFT